MAKNKPPKVTTKEELKSWIRSVKGKNIDPSALKNAHKQIKQKKKVKKGYYVGG